MCRLVQTANSLVVCKVSFNVVMLRLCIRQLQAVKLHSLLALTSQFLEYFPFCFFAAHLTSSDAKANPSPESFQEKETSVQWYITNNSMFHFDFSWDFFFFPFGLYFCSAGSPNGVYVGADTFFAEYLPIAKLPGLIHFILLILEAMQPTG